jgi:hypothetical protein
MLVKGPAYRHSLAYSAADDTGSLLHRPGKQLPHWLTPGHRLSDPDQPGPAPHSVLVPRWLGWVRPRGLAGLPAQPGRHPRQRRTDVPVLNVAGPLGSTGWAGWIVALGVSLLAPWQPRSTAGAYGRACSDHAPNPCRHRWDRPCLGCSLLQVSTTPAAAASPWRRRSAMACSGHSRSPLQPGQDQQATWRRTHGHFVAERVVPAPTDLV